MERQNKNVTHSLCCSWNLEFSDHHDIGREIKNDSFSTWRRFSFWKIFAEEQAENGITYVVVFNAAAAFLHFRILLNLVGHGLHGQFLGDRNNNNAEENHED